MESVLYKASAPGSLMLFGEHAVLHGKQAIVCAIDRRLKVTLQPRLDREVHIHSSLGHRALNLDQFEICEPFQFVLTAIDHYRQQLLTGFDLTITTEFSNQVGLGSSAAVTVATLGVLAVWLNVELTVLALLKLAREVVFRVQGVGSGADVAASVFGGALIYKQDPLVVESLDNLPPIVVIYSGSKMPTKDVVQRVESERVKQPKLFAELDKKIHQCTQDAVSAINAADWSRVGALMGVHQQFQKQMGVSNQKLDSLIVKLNAQPNIFSSTPSSRSLLSTKITWSMPGVGNGVRISMSGKTDFTFLSSCPRKKSFKFGPASCVKYTGTPDFLNIETCFIADNVAESE